MATNEYFSVGGGFVVNLPVVPPFCWVAEVVLVQVNKETQTAENLYYMDIDPSDAPPARRAQSHGREPSPSSLPGLPSPTDIPPPPPASSQDAIGQPAYLFSTASELLQICQRYDLTIGQVIWENELAFRSPSSIRANLLNRAFTKFTVFYVRRLILNR